MESFCEDLGIPKHHIRETAHPERFVLIVDICWLKHIEQKKKITEFPINRILHKCTEVKDLEHPWTKVYVQFYRKSNQKVIPLPKATVSGQEEDLPMTWSQMLSYIRNTNFKNRWEADYKKYDGAHVKFVKQTSSPTKRRDVHSTLVPYDMALRELIQRMFNCSIIHSKMDRLKSPMDPNATPPTSDDTHANVLPALVAIETATHIAVVFYPTDITTTLHDCITYSPAVLGKSFNKSLFLIYQILKLTKSLHDAGLLLGDLRLQDIFIQDNLWLLMIPRLESNIITYDTELATPSEEEIFSESTKFDLKFAYDLEQFSLREYCEMWCNGQLSNFDYLTVLNNATGRRIGSPEYHHIMPWVTDFAQRNGKHWRDLSKSKYRLNKGDPHLDLMFSSSSVPGAAASGATPHHVSDFLSEITYYVYMARRTPQPVLCQHVRPIWVPAEYPVSIQRLQEWTPDECIPEFYSDPMVFKSIHEDLPDLELPAWASCPEDFIQKHREALESQHVSERLHQWIDLNFGYKLTGKAAIKSKNVCLSLVDNHKNLCQRGIVQLFSQPHPPKRFPSPWFGKSPPRLSAFSEQRQRSFIHSSEDISDRKNSPKPSLQYQHSIPNTPEASSDRMERSSSSSSSFYTSSKPEKIILPKDYNPIALLQQLENQHAFLTRTFPNQKSGQNEKLAQNDLLFEESDNSFTNQLFSDQFEPTSKSATKDDKKLPPRQKSFLHQPARLNVKQIQEEKRDKELEIVGCIIIEMFLSSKIRPLTMGSVSISFEDRLESCKTLATKNLRDIPRPLQYAVQLFLKLDPSEYPVTSRGLPPPTAHQVLEPMLSNFLIPFPTSYIRIYAMVRSLQNFNFDLTLLDLYTHFHCNGSECAKYAAIDKQRVLLSRKIAECKVKGCCVHINGLLEPIGYEQFSPVELILPHFIHMLKAEETSILAAWYLFDPVAIALGIKETQRQLLEPILKLYDNETSELRGSLTAVRFSTSSSFKSRKSVKLYHHSFLLRLIVRFGLKCFLENFIPPLIEAVGGYKEPEGATGLHFHSSNRNAACNRSVRSKKNLKFCTDDSDNSLTLVSPDQAQEHDQTLSVDTPSAMDKPEIEDVFSFDDDAVSQVIDPESKSVDSFDIRLMKAEEATEDAAVFSPQLFSPEKLAINDIIYGHQKLSNASFEDDKISVGSQIDSPQRLLESTALGPKSPIIPIPSSFRRSYELSTIDCEIGSKKSVDSFDMGAAVKGEEETKTESEEAGASASTESKAEAETSTVQDDRISEMSTESLIWLSHRLGPVLTARYLTRNLLRMLSLCYVSQENLLPENYDSEECGNLNFFSIADSKVVGDRSAAKVLECLKAIAALYGEQVILLQYLPHASELIALCRKRITPSLEGALISSLQLLKCILPCLVDRSIMENLQDTILGTIINPIVSLLGSTRCVTPSGYLGRSVLARKLLDVIYALSVRIGPEMTKEHLCVPVLQKFFLIFDKAYGILDNFDDYEAKDKFGISPPGAIGGDESLENFDFQLRERAMEEIRDVFGPNLAHCAYLAFLKFLGESIMTKAVINLEFVLTLCHEFERPEYGADETGYKRRLQNFQSSARRSSDEGFIGSNSFGTSVIGNRIEVISTTTRQEIGPIEVLDMVASKFEQISNTRHLRGNWLAYWRHEIARADKDTHLNLKQIKLQTFAGHTNSVRALYPLDNENSFMSASKDKTVKLWSLRSEGDGSKITSCQFTYTSHKKSVHSLAFLESLRYVVSCDSGVHLWDPFIGRPLGILDSHKMSPVTVVRPYPSPSPLVLAGTAESSVKIIDARSMEYVNEWKVSLNQASTVRCLACAPSGNWIAVGLSSGNIVLLDGRTGILMGSWRATDGELLQLVAVNDSEIISSSLDHSISVWNVNDSSLQFQMKQPPEPAHCLQPINGSELVFATPANRIGICSDLATRNGTYSITRLRSETLKGVLTSLAVLPLNRMILTGNDGGNIVLLC